MHNVFITGGTGYMGRRLIPALLERGHKIRAPVRKGSEGKLPGGVEAAIGDALDASTYAARVAPSDTLAQLVGVAYPSPAKAKGFRAIDLPSGLAAVEAATQSVKLAAAASGVCADGSVPTISTPCAGATTSTARQMRVTPKCLMRPRSVVSRAVVQASVTRSPLLMAFTCWARDIAGPTS